MNVDITLQEEEHDETFFGRCPDPVIAEPSPIPPETREACRQIEIQSRTARFLADNPGLTDYPDGNFYIWEEAWARAEQ